MKTRCCYKRFLMTVFGIFSLLFPFYVSADEGKPWSAAFENRRAFIENKGQFNLNKAGAPVLYAYDNGPSMIYFTSQGLHYTFIKRWQKEKGDEKERARERSREQMEGYKDAGEIAEKEKEEHEMEMKSDRISCWWENANPNPEVIATDPLTDYFSYSFFDRSGVAKNVNFIPGYKKLTYKNLYPNIDVEYTFHSSEGIKYAIILHPGADVSQVKLHYSDNPNLAANGDIHIHTKFGDIIDHAPVTFYGDNVSKVVASKFERNGKVISFDLGNYDHAKTLIIDPWVQTPTLAASNGVWECEKDAAGNAYIIGGETPMRLRKYSSAGAVVWTFSTAYDTTNGEWLGSMATDLAGNSYVTCGSTARMTKVNAAGTQVWAVTGGSVDEYWTIAFNCDQTKLIVGGTRIGGGLTPSPQGYIFDINTSNGSVITAVKVGSKRTYTLFGFPVTDGEEVRSITSSRNSRYYFLTLDSIGTIDQNFTVCGTPAPLWAVNHGYSFAYKCETNRPNNGNGAIVAIKANKNFVYTQNGTTVHKRSLGSGAVLASAAIPGGISVASGGMNQSGNQGIDIDSCGNVYVGSGNAILKYDANLNLLTNTAVSFRVSDVAVSYGGNVFVCGTNNDNSNTTRVGYIQQVNMSACDAPVLFCCDATICPAGPYCVTHAPVTLTPTTPGGVWSGPGITNASTGLFSPSVAGVGTWTIKYTLACGADSITIKVNNCGALVACAETNGNITINSGTGPFTWYHQVTTSGCVSGFGNCSGPFTVAGPPTTTWQSFATGTTITPGATYPIYVVNTNHDSLYIPNFAALQPCVSCPTLTVTPSAQNNVACFGQSTGSFSASTAGGASPYDYTLVNASGTVAAFNNVAGAQVFSGLAAGTYTLNVLDNAGCPGSVTITITQPTAALAVSITASVNPSCSGTNGSATAQASNGTSPYDYVWTGASGTLQTTNNITTSNTLSGLASGTYTITVNDNNNCTATTTVVLTNAAAPTVTITAQTNVQCFGASTGSATATAASGSSPYDYVWTGASGTLQTTNNITTPNTLNGLAAGTYTVTVTDNNNCVATQTVTITQPATALTVTMTASVDASCGSSNGSATAQASNGTSPYDYVWTGASGTLQTTNNAAGADVLGSLAAGTYTVTVTDANNCAASTTVVINNSGGPSLSISAQTNITCNGGNNGSATVSASGGVSPYDYVWANASGTIQSDLNIPGPSISSGLTAGTYTVSVTDNNNCLSTQLVTITEPAAITSAMTSTPAGCTANGTATATPAGGTSPYTYAWSPLGGTGSTASSLASGTYTVTITDNALCTHTDTITVGNTGGGLTSTATSTSVSCNGGNNGTATVTPTSGTGPYTYAWSPSGGNNATAISLTAGTYTCTFTDANSCVATQTVTVTEPSAFSITPAQIDVLCSGASTGSATVTVAGGTTPYTYAWTPSGGTANTATGLAAGTYTCTIQDVALCSATQVFTITDVNPPITSTLTSTPASCNQSNGTASVTAGGGAPGYTYSWSPAGGTTTSATGLNPGSYSVTITDANLCTATGTVTVASTAAYTVSISVTPVSCNGGSNGSATAVISGGTAPFVNSWAPAGGAGIATGTILPAGTYTLTTTETATGCQTNTLAVITEPALPITVVSNAQNICYGQSATLTAAGAGGNGVPYNYSWNTGGTTSSISVNPTTHTVYTVTVTDAQNCSAQDTVSVYVSAPLAISVSAGDTLCQGASVTMSATASGGDGTYTITWTPGNQTGSPLTVTPSSSTTYTATVSDGCTVGTVSSTVPVQVLPVPIITFGTNPASGCAPLCPLFAGVSTNVNGNNIDPLSWVWNFGDGTTATGINAAHCYNTPGTYHPYLAGVTTQGCADSSVNNSTVYVYPDPVAGFTASSFTTSIYDNTIDFINLSSGTISAYDWNFANLGSSTAMNPSFTFDPEGTYPVTLTVTNSMGCTNSVTLTVTIVPEFTFYIPNAFTPGGDGRNEIFLPLGTGWSEENYDFWIYDRWGNKIFHTRDITTGWDGRANGGKEIAQIDSYVWKVKLYDVFGKFHEYQGVFSLIK